MKNVGTLFFFLIYLHLYTSSLLYLCILHKSIGEGAGGEVFNDLYYTIKHIKLKNHNKKSFTAFFAGSSNLKIL
jgi:hypothetical protein